MEHEHTLSSLLTPDDLEFLLGQCTELVIFLDSEGKVVSAVNWDQFFREDWHSTATFLKLCEIVGLQFSQPSDQAVLLGKNPGATHLKTFYNTVYRGKEGIEWTIKPSQKGKILLIGKAIVDQKSHEFLVLAQIIALLPGHVYWKNLQGVILGCNERQAQAVGFASSKEFIGKTDYDIYPKEQADAITKVDQQIIATGQSHVVEELITLANGSQRIVLSQKVPLNLSGKIAGILGISTDITERKQIEQELLTAKKELEGRNKERLGYLAVIGCEFRPILHNIQGMAQVLIHEKDLDKKYKDQIQIIEHSSIDMQERLNLLKEYLETHFDETYKKKFFDLRQLLESIIASQAKEALSRNLDLVLHYPNQLPIRINGFSLLLSNIVKNFITNAIRFSNDGCVFIIVAAVPITNEEWNFSIKVEDKGIGISHEMTQTLFCLFDGNDKIKYRGAGFRLSVSKNDAEKMGAVLEVHSELRKGSIFSINFKAEVEKKLLTGDESNSFKDLKIFLLDDEPHRSEVLSHVLEKAGEVAFCPLTEVPLIDQSGAVVVIELPENRLVEVNQILSAIPSENTFLILIGNRVSIEKYPELELADHCYTYMPRPLYSSSFYSQFIDEIHQWKQLVAGSHAMEGYRPKVLVVEDNPLNLKVFVSMLQSHGCDVDGMGNGEAAYDHLKTLLPPRYELIFMDIHLPGMDGIELLKKTRKLYGFKSTPIIAVTAHVSDQEKEMYFDAGFNDVLEKPVSLYELKERLDEFCPNLKKRLK
jgi:PAS domain S-box-containing protein